MTVYVGEKVDTLLIRLEKALSVDYLYRTSIAKDGGISWNNSLLFCGVYDEENHALYLAKDAQTIFTRGAVLLVAEPGDSMMEDICGKINRRVEDILANDKSNLPVQKVTGWLAAHSLEHYRKYGAKEDAIRMLFEDRAPDGVFHSGYAMEELPEAAFLAWLQDPEGFIQTEAEAYIKSDPENILRQFLENDALLAEYQALIQDTGSPIHRMKAITDALNGSNAKMVTVTVQKDEGELTFKMEASQKNDRLKRICFLEKHCMKRAKGDETLLREQGQERVSGRTAGVQRAAGPLRQVQSGERLVSVQR